MKPKLGDEAPVSDTDPRALRVVQIAAPYDQCRYCALSRDKLALCAFRKTAAHPLDCLNLPGDGRFCAVFVDDIPLLTLKGILA